MSKYHNQKTTVCGKTFDSRHEAERYIVLRSLEQSGVITDLRLQVPYELIPTQRIGGKTIRSTYRSDKPVCGGGRKHVFLQNCSRRKGYVLSLL